MDSIGKRGMDRVSVNCLLITLAGIVLNVLLSRLTGVFQCPIYLDTIGTIVVTRECGLMFGILTALVSNALNGFLFDPSAIFYAIVNILIAVCSAYFFKEDRWKRKGGIIAYILALTLIGGILSTLVTWLLQGTPDQPFVIDTVPDMDENIGIGSFFAVMLDNLKLEIVDKVITALLAVMIIWLIPAGIREEIRKKFYPDLLSEEHVIVEALNDKRRKQGHRRMMYILIFDAFCLVVVIAWIALALYTNNARDERAKLATGASRLAADTVDPEKVGEYLAEGKSAEGYRETEEQLYDIRESVPDIEYIYVYQIREDGCHVVFDLDAENGAGKGELPGEVVPFDETFEKYLPTLFAGGQIDPIESNDRYGWLFTAYTPVYDSKGECVAYAGADISMLDIREYIYRFLVRIVLIASGFFVLSVALGVWIAAGYHRLDDWHIFVSRQKQDQELLREIVESYARTIDMKDQYTNGHSVRVAAYTVKLARELGYDEETLNKYYNIALLHDIGKIGVREDVLNKPGKLTDEEFAMIKSHTTLGYEALKNISILPELAVGAWAHHERPDGKGYPRGLKGDEIPRVAQIIAVADTFDAMYSNRPYRKRMNFEKAVSIIKDASGTQLTSDVVDAFLRLVEQGEFRAKDDYGGGSEEDINNIHKAYEEASK